MHRKGMNLPVQAAGRSECRTYPKRNLIDELLNLLEKQELRLLLEEKQHRKARNFLSDFVRSVDLPGVPPSEDDEEDKYYPVRVEPAAHHLLLCDALEKVERREIRRMMVLMPPGSAKSSYASVAFPPWFLGRKGYRSI